MAADRPAVHRRGRPPGEPAPRPFPILLYHRVPAAPDGDPFAVPVERFRRQLEAVAASGRSPLTVPALLARRHEVAPAPVAVTFDDGTADFAERAWPLLRELGIPATVYVTAGLVGGRHDGAPLVSWAQLADLARDGVEIGAHGSHHVALDAIPLHRAALELVNCKLLLEQRLQRRVTTFAYPYGFHSRALERLVARAGFASACAVRNRLSHPQDDRFALARVTIGGGSAERRLEAALRGALPVAGERELLRTRAWRAARIARARTPGRRRP